jgi:hypothetical protein
MKHGGQGRKTELVSIAQILESDRCAEPKVSLRSQ